MNVSGFDEPHTWELSVGFGHMDSFVYGVTLWLFVLTAKFYSYSYMYCGRSLRPNTLAYVNTHIVYVIIIIVSRSLYNYFASTKPLDPSSQP